MSEQSDKLDKTVGAEALVHINFRRQGVRFRVRCRIGEWRRSYNRIEFNVAPIAGEGSAWVREEHVELVLPSAVGVWKVVPYAEIVKQCGDPTPGVKFKVMGVEKCHADRDGDCYWKDCPQIRDGEPDKTGRHCPLDLIGDSDGA